jgi:hypothetical protein
MTTPTQYNGPLITYKGGQTLTGTYQAPSLSTQGFGNVAIDFSSDTQGTMTWAGGVIPIQRFDIVSGGSTATQPDTNPETGWWWNPAESGRGFAIEIQNGSIYFAGYMYDAVGNPIWYLANGPMASANSFEGQWTQYGNGQTLIGPYVPPVLANANAGNVSLAFIDASHAVLTLPGGRQIPLDRFSFGVTAPILSTLSMSSAQPASLVTITGSGIDTTANLSLAITDGVGYLVNIPATAATTTSVVLSVPPYVNVSTDAFTSGQVSVTLSQSTAGATATSNALGGLTIQALPVVRGTAGNATLALIQANLAEAQKLETSIKGTPQDTAAVDAALAQQVTNLQTLVGNIQSVVQQGASFSLGAVGGTDIEVNSSNIGQVDNFILATLQALAASASGSASKSAQQTPGSACMAAEAAAFANALEGGNGNFEQLAKTLLEAPGTSAACNTAAGFISAYQIFGGTGSWSVGITNQSAATGGASAVGGFALFATTTTIADTAVGINGLIAPALVNQGSVVQSGIGAVTALSTPTTNQLLANSTGDLNTDVGLAQNLILTVAPPASTGGPLAVGGTYIGTATASTPVCSGGNSVNIVATIVTNGTALSGIVTGTDPGSNSFPITGTYDSANQTWNISINGTDSEDGEMLSASGTIAGSIMSGTLTDTRGSGQDCPGLVIQGIFALAKQ